MLDAREVCSGERSERARVNLVELLERLLELADRSLGVARELVLARGLERHDLVLKVFAASVPFLLLHELLLLVGADVRHSELRAERTEDRVLDLVPVLGELLHLARLRIQPFLQVLDLPLYIQFTIHNSLIHWIPNIHIWIF